MAIVKMDKFQLLSFDYDREQLLDTLQKFEYVHLNDLVLNEEDPIEGVEEVKIPERLIELQEEHTKVSWVIDFIDKYRPKLTTLEKLKKEKSEISFEKLNERARKFDFRSTYDALDAYDKEISRLEQENQNLDTQIQDLYPWKSLDAPGKELYNMDTVEVFTGIIPVKNFEPLKAEVGRLEQSYVEKISSLKGDAYILAIVTENEKEAVSELLRSSGYVPVIIKADQKPLDEINRLETIIKENKQKIEEVQNQVKAYQSSYEDLQFYKDYLDNVILKEGSRENFLQTESVNIIEGFVPADRANEFSKRVDAILKDRYYLDIKEADRNDPDVPVILKNNKFNQAFEQITKMYALPRYNEIDPTPLLAPFYAFFSGMMVGDAGYGFLVFLAITVGLYLFHFDKGMENFMKFFRFISLCTMFWGVIYNSFFGMPLPFYKPIIDISTDTMPLMILCLIFALIHLFFGLGIKAYMLLRDGKPKDALFDVGFWYMLLTGLIVLGINSTVTFPAIVPIIAKWAAIIAAVGIVLTGGRDEKSPVAKFGWGVYSLYGVTGWLGDFVSYMRLMALGLSGAYIAVAINMIVKMMVKANIPLMIAGVLIFIVFQLFNLFLSFLSAYVHSARLTFVEMFNKFYEGGGKPFKKLIKESDYFNIKN